MFTILIYQGMNVDGRTYLLVLTSKTLCEKMPGMSVNDERMNPIILGFEAHLAFPSRPRCNRRMPLLYSACEQILLTLLLPNICKTWREKLRLLWHICYSWLRYWGIRCLLVTAFKRYSLVSRYIVVQLFITL